MTAVVGATGRVGRLVTANLLAASEPVLALVRDADRARRILGEAPGLTVRAVPFDSIATLTRELNGQRTVVLSMGSIGAEGVASRVIINSAADASVEQLVRLSVFNAGPDSLGINQRAHWSIDQFAAAIGLGYATVQPPIFSASMLVGAAEIRESRTWTGLADQGRIPLIDTRDVAEAITAIVTNPTHWNQHHDITGPALLSWPEALELLSQEIHVPLEFRTLESRELIERLISRGISPGPAELLVAREWAAQAGENERLTAAFHHLTGHAARPIQEFLHDSRRQFLPEG